MLISEEEKTNARKLLLVFGRAKKKNHKVDIK
jgi:hypothetical protein